MKRFRFSLETLLTLRKRKLEKLEAELTALQRRRLDLLGRAAELERRSNEARGAIQLAGRISGADLRRIDASAQALLEQARESRVAARRLERDLAGARKAVLQARQGVEALDKLRERGMEEWRRAADKEEEALAAELYLARRGR